MMYPYLTFADGTEVVHSEIVEENGLSKVFVHFERATDDGFDSARCELPTYIWQSWEGCFSGEEKLQFEQFLRDNAATIYLFAGDGGIRVA